MKRIFQSFICLISLVIFLYPTISNANSAVTNHTVNSGMYYYNPTNLNINVGDTVTWVNDAGYHDVNGDINSTTGLSYNNPESFYLPPTSSPSNIGSYVFTIAGTYNYDCSIGNHAANGMIGTIIVTANSGCTDPTANNYDPIATIDDGSCNYQMTYVPDDNFENYLETSGMGDGVANNDSVFTHSIDTITILNVSFLSIADLTGIEDFTSLNELLVEDNDLPVIDLSSNTALTHLYCQDNNLGDLDLSNNTSLISLNCYNNYLTNINIINSTNLSTLTCYNNNLTNLNLGANTNLDYLACSDNQLSSLDVTTNTLLTYLDCGDNQLTNLDLSVNTTLTDVLCYNNYLTSLDLSNNTLLTQLSCYNNQLSSLDLRNGNNLNMGFFLTTSNANLNCISVDDPIYSTANWINIDAWTSFSINCNAIYGCTDPNAVNYDAAADTDDGSCIDLCNPDPQYTNQGIYPNSLNDGYVGQIYDEAVTIVVPLDVSGITINSIDLTAITGLPNNFTYACNPPNCSFAGGTSGCVNIYSTSQIDTSDIGSYPLDFYTTSNGVIGGIIPITQNDTVDTYSIEILGNAVLGCTDPSACNYDPAATSDDGSCILPDGCTDPTACNFNPLANCDDGSCLTIYGCTDVTACNYDLNATCDDGSCLTNYGCTDSIANNYDAIATCNDGTCTYNSGCTDPTAINYDPTSVIDDGSCIICDLSFTTNVGDNYCPTDIAGYIELIVNGGSGPYTVTYEHMIDGLNGQMYPGYNYYNTTFGGTGLGDTLFMGGFASHNEGIPWIPIPTPIGNQLLTVSDTNGCTVSDSIAIGFNSAYLVDSVVILSNSSCCGACDASATVAVTGSTDSYDYLWDNGDTTAITTNLCSQFCTNTTNTIIIIDSLGCLYGLNFIVPIDSCIAGCTDPTAINYDPNATYDDSSCVACNKSVSQNLMGFDPNPLYALWDWSYDTLTVTNTGNCDVRVRPEFMISHDNLPIDSADFDITWYNSLFGFWASIPYNIDANGNAVGFVSLDPNDSTGQIISQGTTQQVIIRVRFKTGANYGTYCAIWDAIEVDPLGNTIQSLAPGIQTCLSLVDCSNFGVDSSYTTNISCNGLGLSDGQAGILSINNGSGNYSYNWSNGNTNSSINNLNVGTYYCIVTDLNWQQCTDSIVFSITEPAPFSITTSSTPEGCFPNSNGTASAIISGGTPPYSFSWNNGQTSAMATGLSAGTYTLTGYDANGCNLAASPVVVSAAPNLNLVYNSADPTCGGSNDGFITTTFIGGTLPVSYAWQDVNTGLTISTDSAIFGLSQGDYILTATDFYGCSFSTPVFSLTEPDLITTGLTITNATCYGNNDGFAEVFPTGVTPPDYEIYYNGVLSASNIFTPASPGSYTVEIINNITGCSSGIENFAITDPAELTSSYTQTNVTCNGANDGSAIVTFFGGTIGSAPGDTNYILGWAGTPLPVYLPYPQNVFNTTLLPPPYNQIPPGVYPYTVTDLNGCTIYDTITITEPDSLSIVLSSSPVCCAGGNDGIATASASGGTAPYTYLWSNGQTTATATSLSAGIYTCTVVDANGCTVQESINVTENTPITASFTGNDPLCYGDNSGCIYTTASGGGGNFTYLWSPTGDTTADVCNLTAGIYTVIIEDGCGCFATFSVIVSQPNPITLNIDSSDNITAYGWNDGSISISSSGGTGIINTNWTSDNGFTSNDEDITNLFAGMYYLELSDSNGCTFLDTIELTQPSSLWMSLDLAVNTSCFDSCDGSLNITANGGDSTYTYNWIGPNNFTSNNDDITNLCDGEYIITVNDGITSITDTFNIYQPQPLTYILTVDSILCHNGSAQSQINVWGGTQPLTYNWSNGGNTYITTVSAGINEINVVDQNNCSISESFSLTNPDSIISSTTTTEVRCFGGNNGTASITIISGGNAPYSYLWSNGQTGDSIINLSAGTYHCTITDTNGCIDSSSALIIQPDEIISTTNAVDATCYGDCDGSIAVTASGGSPPYSYLWDNGQLTQNAMGLCAGFYNVTIYDSLNCMLIDSGVINEPNPLIINISIVGNSLVASTGFSSYQWYNANGIIIPGETSEVFYPQSIGEYYVVVTQGNCEETSYTIEYNISTIYNYEENIKIYPNPTNGLITIEGIHPYSQISVINSLGNQLIKITKESDKKSVSKLDLSDLANGIYFIQIEDDEQIFNYRIVLQ